MITVQELLLAKGNTVWALTPEDSVLDAIKLMDEKGIGALAVVHNGRLAGILSERDYARKVILKGRSSKDTRIKEIMTTQVYYTFPEQPIDACLVVMSNHHIRHLPVMRNDRLIGMISIGDVVKEIIRAQQMKIEQLENYITWEESY